MSYTKVCFKGESVLYLPASTLIDVAMQWWEVPAIPPSMAILHSPPLSRLDEHTKTGYKKKKDFYHRGNSILAHFTQSCD